MNTFRVILLAVAAQQLVVWGPSESAVASCPPGSSSVVGVRSVRNAITMGAQAGSSPGHCGGTGSAGESAVGPNRDPDRDAACVRRAISGGFDPFGLCDLVQ
jgi:hypothetical protein